ANAIVAELPNVDPCSIGELFAASLDRMALETPDGALTEEDVIAKVERAQERASGLRVEEEQAAARKRFVRAGRGKYTAEEVQQLADGLGVSVEQLQHCWILQRHSQYYVL